MPEEISSLLSEDLYDVMSGKNLFLWKQKSFSPWWEKLEYKSEQEARADLKIESEKDIRDYRVLISEIPRFDISLVQGPLYGRTSPLGFCESLEVILKKQAQKNFKEKVPAAYIFFDRKEFTQEQIDYFSSPRFIIERMIRRDYAHIDLKGEGVFGRLDRRSKIQEIPEADALIRELVMFSNIKNNIFDGNGIEDEKVKAQLKEFKTNLQASYGIAIANEGSGIIVSGYHYGV